MPPFDPLRVRGARRLRLTLRRRRAMAACLAMTATALATGASTGAVGAAPGTGPAGRAGSAAGSPAAGVAHGHRPTDVVSVPVRIADAATVGLLRRGDRVDVIAPAPAQGIGGRAQQARQAEVLASGARVTAIPAGQSGTTADGGALIVLSVPRATAAPLAAASATSQLALALC